MSDAIDHRAIVAGLSAEQRSVLTGRRNGPGLLRLAVHGGAILALGALILAGVPFWPLLLLPQGILIVFLFTLLHECVHETAFETPWLNRTVAAVAGFLVMVPATWFRYFHFAHHRHTHDPDNDPELMSPKPETLWEYVKYLSGIPLWMGMARTVLLNGGRPSPEPYVPEKGRRKVHDEARLTLALYGGLVGVSIALGTDALLWIWVFPALLGQPFLRAYLLAEHARCPHVANMLENTRTTFTTALVRFFAWNMPYHAEHHAYPAVPFHRLPQFHEVVREHLRTTERGYGRFHRRFIEGLR
jgi:fatty acid desaturase